MTWRVILYLARRSGTYDGRGSRNIYRDFDDSPSAHRWAKEQVEAGPALTATVERLS